MSREGYFNLFENVYKTITQLESPIGLCCQENPVANPCLPILMCGKLLLTTLPINYLLEIFTFFIANGMQHIPHDQAILMEGDLPRFNGIVIV
jgi:hypothetical protein